MSEIADWISAQLDADEAAAREAIAYRTRIWPDGTYAPDFDFVASEDLGVPAVIVGPERVLVEVEAKRAIMARHQPDRLEPDVCAVCASHVELWPCRTVRSLAAPYRDHPGYQEGWAL